MRNTEEMTIPSTYINRKEEDIYEGDRHQEVFTLEAHIYGKHVAEFEEHPEAFLTRLLEADGKKVNALKLKLLRKKKDCCEDENAIHFTCKSYHQITPKKENSTYIIVCDGKNTEMPKRIPW